MGRVMSGGGILSHILICSGQCTLCLFGLLCLCSHCLTWLIEVCIEYVGNLYEQTSEHITCSFLSLFSLLLHREPFPRRRRAVGAQAVPAKVVRSCELGGAPAGGASKGFLARVASHVLDEPKLLWCLWAFQQHRSRGESSVAAFCRACYSLVRALVAD